MNIRHPKNPFSWISKDSWNKLDLKAKDYLIFLRLRKYTKTQICRKLYIETDS